ncbi:hypothetical protein SAMN05428997_11249 [Bosea sp. CRIB-10]|nr:hypothetical protein SAMN05428997_11249 [Bosea sp. CRIB-10]
MRSSHHTTANLVQQFATEPAEWLRFRERPVVHLGGEQILLVRQPQRPDEAQKELASFPTPEAANEYLRSNFPEAASQG